MQVLWRFKKKKEGKKPVESRDKDLPPWSK